MLLFGESGMSNKRKIAGIIALILLLAINVYIFRYEETVDEEIDLTVEVQGEKAFTGQVFYLTEGQDYRNGFVGNQMVSAEYKDAGDMKTLSFSLPSSVSYIRLDLGEISQELTLGEISLEYHGEPVLNAPIKISDAERQQMIASVSEEDGYWNVETEGDDPYFIYSIETASVIDHLAEELQGSWLLKKILMCLAVDVIALIAWLKWDQFMDIPKELVQNRKLILNLAKNDFKSRFSGSIFGILWAFVSPIVTVLLYWFVFEKALNVGSQSTKAGIAVPYVLWLVAGLVPWFYFSEAWSSGTNALVEYSYLVKKVVFKISALPVVKVVSSLFVHLFFIAFMLILYFCYQYYPTPYMLQIIYYSVAMIAFTLGLTYITAALVPFFRDLSQIIGILMQVLMWMTPILWNIDGMTLNPIISGILKLNPMYYIVSGYRDALIDQVWFWDRLDITVYFWVITAVVFGIGTTLFKKLQVHFADVL